MIVNFVDSLANDFLIHQLRPDFFFSSLLLDGPWALRRISRSKALHGALVSLTETPWGATLQGEIWGFPARHGGTPIAGWFFSWKIPSINGRSTGGVPLFQETSICFFVVV